MNSQKRQTTTRPWTLRRVHKLVAVLASPFIIISALAGGLLLLRTTGLYQPTGDFHQFLRGIHNYEIVAVYVGLIPVVLMLAAAITGLMLFARPYRKKRK